MSCAAFPNNGREQRCIPLDASPRAPSSLTRGLGGGPDPRGNQRPRMLNPETAAPPSPAGTAVQQLAGACTMHPGRYCSLRASHHRPNTVRGDDGGPTGPCVVIVAPVAPPRPRPPLSLFLLQSAEGDLPPHRPACKVARRTRRRATSRRQPLARAVCRPLSPPTAAAAAAPASAVAAAAAFAALAAARRWHPPTHFVRAFLGCTR